jgi:prophage antirepressor-like protein
MQEIIVKNWKLVQPESLEGHWITAKELGTHLGYAEPGDAVTRIYKRHQEAFRDEIDTCTVNLTVQLQTRSMRVFSERGVLKVIRYSNTEVADAVMDEVFDVYLAVRKKAKDREGSLVPTASDVLADWLKASALLKVPEHLAQVEAIKATKIKTGIDYASLLLVAPAQDDVPDEEIYLEVTKIGQLLGLGDRKGAEVNKFLKKKGLQKKVSKLWEATADGKKHSQNHQWFSDGCSGFNLKWRVSLVKSLWEKHEKEKKDNEEKKKEEEERILAALPRQETIFNMLAPDLKMRNIF